MPVICVSVGWLLFDGSECKAICANMGDVETDEPQGTGVIEIPTASIQSIKKLTETTSVYP